MKNTRGRVTQCEKLFNGCTIRPLDYVILRRNLMKEKSIVDRVKFEVVRDLWLIALLFLLFWPLFLCAWIISKLKSYTHKK